MPGRISRTLRSLAGSSIGKATTSCKTATELVSSSFHRKLTVRERIRVRLHLMVCNACRNYLSNLRMMGDALNEPLLGDDDGNGLSDEALERIRQRLNK